MVSSINKTDCHNITEILLKVVLNTINPNPIIRKHGIGTCNSNYHTIVATASLKLEA
jgi:hypothetical protein